MKKKEKGLVGKFFHSLDGDGVLKWQGFIIQEPKKDVYLCQLFDWLMGDPCNQCLVNIDDMKHWLFYDSGDDMRYSAQYGVAYSHSAENRKKQEKHIDA